MSSWEPRGGARCREGPAAHPDLPADARPREADPGRHWKASPATRMMELLHATDVRLGLVTNGEHWMLVDAPGGRRPGSPRGTRPLVEEPLTLRAFRSLLGVHRFFSVPDDETLEALLRRAPRTSRRSPTSLAIRSASRRDARAVARQADQDEGRQLLAGVSEAL